MEQSRSGTTPSLPGLCLHPAFLPEHLKLETLQISVPNVSEAAWKFKGRGVLCSTGLCSTASAWPKRSWAGREGCSCFNSFQEQQHKSRRRQRKAKGPFGTAPRAHQKLLRCFPCCQWYPLLRPTPHRGRTAGRKGVAEGSLFSNFSLFLSEELDRNRVEANRGVPGAGRPAVLQSWRNLLRLALPRTGTIERGIVGWAFPGSMGRQF